MCEELENELNEGKRIATELAAHLLAMGASKATIPVFVADEQYEITVRHIPVEEAT